ncbi:MAG: winged helix-turn-helix domain-containing protein [Planctomycetota bacterium]|jgi:DNA-binding transcriptional ArsR family regulator
MNQPPPYQELERTFHEPNRLAIMSELAGAPEGLSFSELKQHCGLTDGNLSRHLKALETAGAVIITKTFVGAKPRTTAVLTDAGRSSFLDYLAALEQILKAAEARMKGPATPPAPLEKGDGRAPLPA